MRGDAGAGQRPLTSERCSTLSRVRMWVLPGASRSVGAASRASSASPGPVLRFTSLSRRFARPSLADLRFVPLVWSRLARRGAGPLAPQSCRLRLLQRSLASTRPSGVTRHRRQRLLDLRWGLIPNPAEHFALVGEGIQAKVGLNISSAMCLREGIAYEAKCSSSLSWSAMIEQWPAPLGTPRISCLEGEAAPKKARTDADAYRCQRRAGLAGLFSWP